jgi:hypothetical protein
LFPVHPEFQRNVQVSEVTKSKGMPTRDQSEFFSKSLYDHWEVGCLFSGSEASAFGGLRGKGFGFGISESHF